MNRDQSPISTVNANPVSEEMPRRQPSRLTGSANRGEAWHRAGTEGRWATTMRFYAGPTLLAIDEELGYLPLPNEAASALFQVVSQRYFSAAGQITKRHFDASKEKSFGVGAQRGEVVSFGPFPRRKSNCGAQFTRISPAAGGTGCAGVSTRNSQASGTAAATI